MQFQDNTNIKFAQWLSIASICLLSIGLVQAQEPEVRGGLSVIDWENVDQSQIEWGYSEATTVDLSDALRSRPIEEFRNVTPRDAGVSLRGTVSIKPYLLQPTAPPDATGAIVGAVPPNIRHVALELDGARFVLDVVAVEFDPVFGFRHVTAAVVSHPPDGHALFTIDVPTGLIVGTIQIQDATYRIVPSGARGTQLAYAIEERGNDFASARHNRIIDAAGTTEASRVERRHLQALTVRDLQPSSYSDDGLLVRLREGEEALGHMDVPSEVNSKDILGILFDLAPLTHAKGDEMFEIVAVRSPAEAEGRYVVSYRQVAHGIPIGNPRDIVFSADGKILSVEAALLDSSTLPDATDRMTDADALATAVGALELRYGAAGGFEYKHLAEKTSLAYRPMEGKWVPVWRSIFSISTNDHSGHYWVSVNVLTGETTIASAAFQ